MRKIIVMHLRLKFILEKIKTLVMLLLNYETT